MSTQLNPQSRTAKKKRKAEVSSFRINEKDGSPTYPLKSPTSKLESARYTHQELSKDEDTLLLPQQAEQFLHHLDQQFLHYLNDGKEMREKDD